MSSLAFDLSLQETFYSNSDVNELLAESIAQDLVNQGFSVQKNALSLKLADSIYHYIQAMQASQFNRAGIGRGETFDLNNTIRRDDICWIDGGDEVTDNWLEWAESLKEQLNQKLFLGLSGLESHFAHYAPGDFYKTHVDAFKGQSNRKLSLVAYFNPDWQAEDGGELIIYPDKTLRSNVKVAPALGTVVVFLSEDIPHEVLTTYKNRYSIACWFRNNEVMSLV